MGIQLLERRRKADVRLYSSLLFLGIEASLNSSKNPTEKFHDESRDMVQYLVRKTPCMFQHGYNILQEETIYFQGKF